MKFNFITQMFNGLNKKPVDIMIFDKKILSISLNI
ncbi:hypothetical protein B0S90_0656 [Caldicellulosiruptor bescii]|uniref:Uncharacterized protein n=2 Tax=Caldicellulosiruptor bescii TaxID=31899 RepID=B9MN63_CALBD|nr:hypothetical protein Athe_0385 [Caldicellulosiruptor bescii DSM 6725]PBC89550.1 hypothetical protein B0S87_2658 [Caldicellulosiruptor bescii]PBC89873.1 hypothetical protein B0S89_0160 [Caldicellulosiruptor bescii]PBD04701.1 hypothetical protein B0S85_2389 [Caldicellulosiruptor bescii]PBD05669.1 hypothetical protein B0S90_0656 [Caldicellulosiruptor bescii]